MFDDINVIKKCVFPQLIAPCLVRFTWTVLWYTTQEAEHTHTHTHTYTHTHTHTHYPGGDYTEEPEHSAWMGTRRRPNEKVRVKIPISITQQPPGGKRRSSRAQP